MDNPASPNTAKNIGIVLYDRNDMNTDIIINGSVTKEYEVSSSAEWHVDYVAKYYSTADNVEAGQADATLNYTLSYN
ncbi:fimbrial protein [Morganella morganii]|uniref:fimbrial protein n=1 Tax=Morganella morganii TaxID=582 RepID=UPI0024950143|nr:fimbrial protein [Morganella morganii]